MVMSSFKKSKGQFVTTDFSLAVSILIFLFVLGIIIWNSTSTKISQNTIKNEMETVSIDVSDQLLKSQGLPADWETQAVLNFSLGLIDRGNELNPNKFVALTKLNYNYSKSLLGIRGYEFYVRATDVNGNIKSDSGTPLKVGIVPVENSTIVNSKRIAILQNEIIYLDVMIWK